MKPYHKNPRVITDGKLTSLGDSLSNLGDLGGIVHDLNSDEIIGGNQRGRVFDINECEIEIVHQLDEPDEQGTIAHGFVVWQGKRYAYRQVRWTPRQAEEANIKANRLGGEWDWEQLAESWNYEDLTAWGFEADELDEWFADEDGSTPGEDTEPQIDKAAELLEKWKVQPGDMFAMGAHRLICGDCTDAATVGRLMGEERAEMGFTSPPYADRRSYDSESGFVPVPPDEYVQWFHPVANNAYGALSDAGVWVVNICPGAEDRQRRRYVLDLVVAHLSIDWGWLFLDEYVWPAGSMPLDPRQIGRFKQGFEMLYAFCKGQDYKFRPDNVMHESDSAFTYGGVDARISHDYQGTPEGTKRTKMQNVGHGMAYPSTLLSKIGKDAVIGHAATFPVGLPEFFSRAYTDEGDAIYEPFAGSGTTIIACENLARKCRAIEISPAYCAVILERFFMHTGQQPERIE